jgi:hypothetical protein
MLSIVICYCVFSLLLREGKSAPVQNHDAVGWVSDPNGRGTFGLVSSCVITQGLCIWSALHLNIPPKYKTKTQKIYYNTKWVILGALIPELVILSAWRQWLSARKMTSEMKSILENEAIFRKDSAVSCPVL